MSNRCIYNLVIIENSLYIVWITVIKVLLLCNWIILCLVSNVEHWKWKVQVKTLAFQADSVTLCASIEEYVSFLGVFKCAADLPFHTVIIIVTRNCRKYYMLFLIYVVVFFLSANYRVLKKLQQKPSTVLSLGLLCAKKLDHKVQNNIKYII